MEYLSLKEYQTIAKKLLNASFPKLAYNIINDNEKLGEVIHALVLADQHFDGRGTLHGYRKQRVTWVISSIYSKQSDDLSLNFKIGEKIELCDTIAHKAGFDETDYADRLENLGDKLTKSKVLTEKEKNCISQYFIESVELADIATNLDIHKEAVKMSIRRGLSKLGLYDEYSKRFEERKKRRRQCKDNTGTDGI
jgi:predicted DNA-binding protein YlxM (UPF0122 family)